MLLLLLLILLLMFFIDIIIDVFLLMLNPSPDTEAVVDPFTIWFNCKPVTPDAGILIKFEPSP